MNNQEQGNVAVSKKLTFLSSITKIFFVGWIALCPIGFFLFNKVYFHYLYKFMAIDPNENNAALVAWRAARKSYDLYETLRDITPLVTIILTLLCVITGFYYWAKRKDTSAVIMASISLGALFLFFYAWNYTYVLVARALDVLR